MMDTRVTNYFNDLLADVEWQNGLTPSQRDIAMTFAQTWILDAVIHEQDIVRAYTNAREALRHIANLYRGETFVLHRGEQTTVMEK